MAQIPVIQRCVPRQAVTGRDEMLLSPVRHATQAERLQYYETLMLACERLGCPEGAARFAQAAVRQIDVAFPADGRAAGGAPGPDARATREGRLWSNLFVYSLDVSQYEVRAQRNLETTRLCTANQNV